jgi:flagellar biosynthesis protein FlhF
MQLETFHADTVHAALKRVRAALGEDAMIVHTRDRGQGAEVVAAASADVGPLRERLEAGFVAVPDVPPGREQPYVVGLVGPTGAGKTTTAVKLALHADAFGRRRVGFLALDTYRVAALEQLQTYADIMDAPLEVAYHAGDVGPALGAMQECDVVIVDAPGRSPTHQSFRQWRVALDRARPDEVHLVLPATIAPTVGRAHRDGYRGCGLSHLLVTKLDEMPEAGGVIELAETVGLPVRWSTDGQEVPGDLRKGGLSLLTSATRAAEEARIRLVG